jgi:hypothetical protein
MAGVGFTQNAWIWRDAGKGDVVIPADYRGFRQNSVGYKPWPSVVRRMQVKARYQLTEQMKWDPLILFFEGGWRHSEPKPRILIPNMNAKSLLSMIASLPTMALMANAFSPPEMAWQLSAGGNGNDSLRSLRQTADGGYILAGWSESDPSGTKTSPYFGGVGSDLWVVRLDPGGQILWDKSFGGEAQEGTACSIRQTRDGGFILGTMSRSGVSGNKTTPQLGGRDFFDLWVIRLDPGGNKLWEASYGGANNEFFASVEETADGGFIVGASSDSGATGNKTSPNYSLLDYWVVRLDAGGGKLWDASFGGTRDDELHALQPTTDGGFILGGESWSGAGGNKTSPSYGEQDFWVVRLDAAGHKVWEQSYGGSGRDALYALGQTANGGFLFGGSSYSDPSGSKSSPRWGIIDYWIVRVDAGGAQLWDRTFGGGGISVLEALSPTGDGGFVLAGSSDETFAAGQVGNKTSPSFGGNDYWMVRIDGLGNQLWDMSLGGTSEDVAFDVQQTSDGGYLVGGESQSGTDGNKSSPAFGALDFWIVKLAPPDSDGDGVPDADDLCPDTPAGAMVNGSGCSIDQLCPCDGTWRNHGEFVSCVAQTSALFVKLGLISESQRLAMIRAAANSNCGK